MFHCRYTAVPAGILKFACAYLLYDVLNLGGPQELLLALTAHVPDVASGAVTSTSVNVIPPEVPVVFWLPAVLTPVRSIAALPLKETPPIVRAVDSVAAVVAVEAFPLSAPLKVAAVTVPSVLREI